MDNVALARRAFSYMETAGYEGTGSVQALFDLLGDDVVFRGTYPQGTPFSGEFRGKDAVVAYHTDHPDLIVDHEQERPLEFLGDGDRVVILGASKYTIARTGVTVRDREYATIVDFRDGEITSILVVTDATEVGDAYRTAQENR